jgi:tetratricopeptide (TPR) repeat protein
LPIIHYYASEYYRRGLESGQVSTLEGLSSFIYHAFGSGEYERAFIYVFESLRTHNRKRENSNTDLDAFEQPFFEFGSETALRLHEVLGWFLDYDVDKALSVPQRARVLVELAHLSSDLGDFSRCIQLTSRASELLSAELIDDRPVSDMWRRIWYYQGVSFSNTGLCADCVRSFFKVVESAPSGDALGILCLGYLAHALLYLDLDCALKYGAESVVQARASGNPRLIAKNLASHAEVLIFAGHYQESDAYFAEAASLCRRSASLSTEARELGRIMKNWGALSLAQGNLDIARQRLVEALELSEAMGDFRRLGSGQLYLAVVLARLGDRSAAIAMGMDAISTLRGMRNPRYVVPAILTIARWQNAGFSGGVAQVQGIHVDDALAAALNEVAGIPGVEIYADFWRQHYWPTLCEG